MSKKVCLITYINSPNYGASLQMFATYKAIEKCEHDPVLLNYVNVYENSQTSLKYLIIHKRLKAALRLFISGYVFKMKINSKNLFGPFYNQFRKTCKVYSVNDLEKLSDIDIFCVGSDQVWNPLITNGYDDVFFLNTSCVKKKISYASSMGSINYEVDENYLRKALGDFQLLSVREKKAGDLLSNILNRRVEIVSDPTMLFNKQEWISLLNIKGSRLIQDDYILIYALDGKFPNLKKVAQKYAAILHCKIACVTLSSRPKGVDYLIDYADPGTFVKAIFEARLVITNSFHGTCFSIIGKVPFISILFNNNTERARGLLSRYALESRLTDCDHDVNRDYISSDDIINANVQINMDRTSSLEWLNRALNDENI